MNVMNLDALNETDCDKLISSIGNKLIPIFKKYTDDEKRAIYRYLFSRRPKKVPPSLKNHLINLYNPMADRSNHFTDGLRFCLNVYVGCEHNCSYCYVNGYNRESVGISPHSRVNFEKKLIQDLKSLKSFHVPPAPVHISNSTDPLQENLEKQNRHTLLSLQIILEYRELFTSIVILTKNPAILCSNKYLSIIRRPEMRPIIVQVTCSYWRDNVRLFFEPDAPSIPSRLEAIKFLSKNGIDVELRIDPLFPSSRIEKRIRMHEPLSYYSIPEAQSQDDIINLIRFAKESGLSAVIAKPLKVPVSNKAQQCKKWFGNIYKDAYENSKRRVKGGSWRLPDIYQKALVSSVSDLCDQEGVSFKHCMKDVLTRF